MLSLQRKSEYHVAVAKKAKQMWDVKTERIMYAVHAQTSLFEMSLKNWVNTTLCHFYKRNWYIMLILCWWDMLMNIKTLFANHFKCSFYQIKACLVWKLCLISFPSQLTIMRLLILQKFCSIVCAIFPILLSSYFEVIIFAFFSQLKMIF